MDEIFIIQLAERAKKEEGMLELLPEDVKTMVEERLAEQNSQYQEPEITEQ